MNVAVVIVAAGQSQRFGAAKMQHRMQDGRSLLDHSIDIYLALTSRLVVVVPAGDDALKAIASARGVEVVECVDASLGISKSIRAGIEAVLDAPACLIALGDMPYVNSRTIKAMLNVASVNNIVLPSMTNTRGDTKAGNPVIFAQPLYGDLLELQGDVGGKSVVKAHANLVRLVAVDDPGIFADVDRPSDLLAHG